ncbi:MAG: GTP cyclohydrolase, partial [Marinomonas sp.]
VRLLTNNPDKAEQLTQNGVEVEQLVPTQVHVNQHNRNYLEAKVRHKQHTIKFD